MKHLSKVAILSSLTPTLAAPEVDIVTVTAAPAIPSKEPEWNSWDVFTSAVLNSTNTYRSQHNASDLSWNDTLTGFAVEYLEETRCEFKHSGGPYGENLAMGYPNVTASVEAWGNEREEYDWGDQGFSEKTGHFTQLVWENTTDVGCWRQLCGERGWYLVCEYWPPGNVAGAYEDLVDEQIDGSERMSVCLLTIAAAFGVSALGWL